MSVIMYLWKYINNIFLGTMCSILSSSQYPDIKIDTNMRGLSSILYLLLFIEHQGNDVVDILLCASKAMV